MLEEVPRLSPVEAEILRLLVQHREMYGLELVAASDVLKRGTIYVTLGRMAEKGFVSSRTVKLANERGLPRRLFSLTGLGERAIRAFETANAVWRESFA
jgi:DNA-binding PadR family transcriptional regulator